MNKRIFKRLGLLILLLLILYHFFGNRPAPVPTGKLEEKQQSSETPNGQNGGQPLTPQSNHIFEKGRVSEIMTQSGDHNRTDNKLRGPKIKYIGKGAVITSETPNREKSGQPLTPQGNHIFEKGRVLFKEGKYHEALVALKESILN